jgi:hypothetical protein
MATGKKVLAASVHVYDEERGTVVYSAGDTVPANHAKQITNEKAWTTEDSSGSE